MQHIKKVSISLALILASSSQSFGENIATAKSPDGKLSLAIENTDGAISYSLQRGAKVIVDRSKVGLITSVGDFSTDIIFKSVDTKDINTSFSLPSASQATIADICREITINVEKAGQQAAIIFRLYDEGMAWRYRVDGSGDVTVTGDAGEVVLPSQDEYLSLPLSKGTRASFADSHSDLMECLGSVALPLIGRNDDDYVVISETAPTKNFCGSSLKVPARDIYTYSPIENISAILPLSTPWRTVTTGKLTQIAAGHMYECLAEPTTITNTSWIKPGRSANAYSGEDHMASYIDSKTVNTYIDWAATQGWEYFTIDKRSNLTTSQLREIVNYAKSKNIDVFVWKNRASLPTAENALRSELVSLKQAGVKGIKVEFWERESQDIINQRNSLLSLAAEQQLMVILSNTVNTVGLSRTWPNLMGTELGLSNSSYVFTPDMVGASHNINSAILYASAGPVDYSPVDFAEHTGKLLQSTTHAHQLALAVAFQSGVQHIIDAPDNLRYSIAKNILKTLPAKWDDTQWLDAVQNQSMTLVRRSGEEYYLASLTTEATTTDIPLTFLPAGKRVNAYIYSDGSCPTDIRFEYKEGLTSASTLSIPMAKNGGLLVRLADDDGSTKPFYRIYEAESADNNLPFGVSVIADRDDLCSGKAYVSGAGFGRPITINNISVPSTGTYAINVYYMASEASSGTLRLNGSLASIRGLNFIHSGGTTGRSLACVTVTMPFDKTDGNTIQIASSVNLPSIDRITITDNETLVYTSGIEKVCADATRRCKIYAEGDAVAIETPDDASYAIYDLLGRCLASGKAPAGKSTVSPDDSDMVIVKVWTNTSTQTEKLIIH